MGAGNATARVRGQVMAEAGVAARRKCEDIVISGRVKVNGEICYVPQTMVKAPPDRIEVDGKLLSGSMPSKLYFMVNKPKGYICSSVAGDTEAGKRAVDILEPFFKRWKQGKPAAVRIPRVFTVGRLDVASQGLLLISNDGGWAHQITHPSGGVTKEYVVRLNKPPTKGELRALAAGCEIAGRKVVPEFVALAGSDPNSADRVRIVVMEGRNREVRRIVEAAGMDVLTLKRVRIGGLQLPKDLGLGGFRQLKPNEVKLVLDKGAQNNAIFNRMRLAAGR